ncbi:MAG: hypothetical protein AAFW84_04830 [Cyanobacteria bacterium J06635_15]
MSANIEHLNPNGLHQNPAFSQVVVTADSMRIVYVGGQNAINSSGVPILTLLFVAGLAHPDFLMEMDAVAVIPNP